MRFICVAMCEPLWKFENKRKMCNKKQHQNKLKKIFKYSENKVEKGETWGENLGEIERWSCMQY